ncbi:MAG: hypothetical protein JXR77_04435, partial [Lentisphaeria bacterium]|nr:hypothetical protein [Lentisphaeria bacterium]
GLSGPVTPECHQVTEFRDISGRGTSTSGLQLEQPSPIAVADLALRRDDTWQTAECHLLDAIEPLYPDAPAYPLTDIHFGNWSNAGYLQCGFGGNPAGCGYSLDNVHVGAPAPAPVRFTWHAGEGTALDEWSLWRIDRALDGVPDGRWAKGTGQARVDGLGSGWWTFHLASVDARGGVRRVIRRRFRVDGLAPAVIEVAPADGAEGAPEVLRVRLDEPGGAGLDRRSVSLTVDGKGVPAARIDLTGTAAAPEILADLTGFEFDDGERVRCSLRVADRAGNWLTPHTWEWVFRRALDRVPPSLPELVYPVPAAWDGDFERPGDDWEAFPGSAWTELRRDDTTASSGTHSLRIQAGPGPYACMVCKRPIDLHAYPLLSLGYRATRQSVWDLAFETDRGWFVVAVNGGTADRPRIGKLPEYRPDGQWQTALLPLETWLRPHLSGTLPVVHAVAVMASAMHGATPAVVHLDDMRPVPAVWPGGSPIRWAAEDAGGIRGFAVVVDRALDTLPPAGDVRPLAEWPVGQLAAGLQVLHLRAVDQAGNWGPVRHQPLFVRSRSDDTPPAVVSLWPSPGSRIAANAVRVELEEEGSGIALGALGLRINGRHYAFRDPEIRVAAAGTRIEWQAAPPAPHLPAFRDGEVVRCRLDVADRAGNRPQPVEWQWTMDLRSDRTPPGSPYVSRCPEGAHLAESFDADRGPCMGRREGWAEWWPRDAAVGAGCVRLGGFSSFLCHTPFDASQFPLLSFDCRIPRGGSVNLLLRIANRNWEIRLTSDQLKYPLLGRVDGIAADGQWHACLLDIATMLAETSQPVDGTRIDHVATLNKTPEPFFLDNLSVGPAMPAPTRFLWSVPPDPAGIQGYSIAIDSSHDTVPDETIDTTEPSLLVQDSLPAGTWLHVRAVDGAGNAGPPGHATVRTR